MLSKNLKRIMTDRAMTPEALSVKLAADHDTHVTAGAVASWLRGTRTPPVATLISVARCLGTTLDDLLVRDIKAAV